MHAKQEYTDHKNIDVSVVKNIVPVDMFIDYGIKIFCHGSYLPGSSLKRRKDASLYWCFCIVNLGLYSYSPVKRKSKNQVN